MRALPPARKAAVAYALKVRPRSVPQRRDPALRCAARRTWPHLRRAGMGCMACGQSAVTAR